jgi:outer membrane biosynthesis protein TonB
MRKGIIVSAALHMGVIGATMVTWPSAFSQSEEALPIVPVELITIADATNIQATAREIEPPAPDIPEPEPAIAEPEPEPELVEALPPEPLPELEPEPEPEPEEVAELEPEPDPPPPAPVEKPEPQRDEFNLDSVIALLESRAPAAAPAPPADQTRAGIGDNSAMTMNLVDLLRTQMYQCWSPPIGSPNPEELIVEVNVYLAPNGGLARAPQLSAASRAAAAGNPFMRAAAESALRAVNICAPYRNLPADQYGQWNEVRIIFDPTRMAGR